ncbi:MAG: hypothetical protein AAGA58_01525 [Verrucomicrobiota bacterium]
MFELPLSQLFILYLTLVLGLLFAVWLGDDWVRKRRERINRRNHLVCNICGVPYEDATREKLPECPSCGARNERLSLRDI